MVWFIFGYSMFAYWYYRAVLRAITAWDSAETVLLNSALALTIGPILLVPVLIFAALGRLDQHIWQCLWEGCR
jgi:hypothetical protein